MSKLYPEVTCPYCGNTFKVQVKAKDWSKPFIINCDIDDSPGCDKLFVVKVNITVTAGSLKVG